MYERSDYSNQTTKTGPVLEAIHKHHCRDALLILESYRVDCCICVCFYFVQKVLQGPHLFRNVISPEDTALKNTLLVNMCSLWFLMFRVWTMGETWVVTSRKWLRFMGVCSRCRFRYDTVEPIFFFFAQR